MLRLFFALQPAAAQGLALVRSVQPLVEELQAQRVPAENLHATLCFMGAVAPEKLEPLCAAAAQIRGRHATLQFDALDFWEKPRVLCATAGGVGAQAACDLAQALAASTIAAGFAPDVKPFRAHLTLARKVPLARVAGRSWPLPLEPAVAVHCERFVLMKSERGNEGSVYSVVNSWPLEDD